MCWGTLRNAVILIVVILPEDWSSLICQFYHEQLDSETSWVLNIRSVYTATHQRQCMSARSWGLAVDVHIHCIKHCFVSSADKVRIKHKVGMKPSYVFYTWRCPELLHRIIVLVCISGPAVSALGPDTASMNFVSDPANKLKQPVFDIVWPGLPCWPREVARSSGEVPATITIVTCLPITVDLVSSRLCYFSQDWLLCVPNSWCFP